MATRKPKRQVVKNTVIRARVSSVLQKTLNEMAAREGLSASGYLELLVRMAAREKGVRIQAEQEKQAKQEIPLAYGGC